MSPRLEPGSFSPDTQQFLALLHRHQVRYLIVGGEAVILYGFARLTGDVDFFYDASADNAKRLFQALLEFWSGDIPGLQRAEELQETGAIIQFGRPPNRIDLINQIDGVNFAEAWATQTTLQLETVPVHYIGLDCLLKNKRASARAKDLADLEFLSQLKSPPPTTH